MAKDMASLTANNYNNSKRRHPKLLTLQPTGPRNEGYLKLSCLAMRGTTPGTGSFALDDAPTKIASPRAALKETSVCSREMKAAISSSLVLMGLVTFV
mmetsp:Transcript_75956/g.180633  ORF Transcript_75956/g.180633 Transcript_75956/m.180633 type:complete len:98 (-) Transcript_75956:977-1270(-)